MCKWKKQSESKIVEENTNNSAIEELEEEIKRYNVIEEEKKEVTFDNEDGKALEEVSARIKHQ